MCSSTAQGRAASPCRLRRGFWVLLTGAEGLRDPGVGVYFHSDPAKPTYVHEAVNLSQSKPLKLVTTLITEKGQPLAIPVK